MKTIYIFSFIYILSLPLAQPIFAQCEPIPEICDENDCMIPSVDIGLIVVGNNSICAGDTAFVAIDPEETIDFDYLVYYWCDGIVDTINFNDQPASHVYNVDPEDICDDDQSSFLINVIGILECPAGITCRTTAVSLTVKNPPRADFSIPNTVCVGDLISPNDESCNAISQEWDFGDGTIVGGPNPTHFFITPGQYTIKQIVNNDCGMDMTTRTINVVGFPEPSFNIITETPPCTPTEVTLIDESSPQLGNTSWMISPDSVVAGTLNWCFTDTLMTLNSDSITVEYKQPGTYTISLIQQNICAEEIIDTIINILESPDYQLEDINTTFCDVVTLTESDVDFSVSGDYNSVTWTLESGSNSTSIVGESFSYEFDASGWIILEINGPCGEIIDSVEINVASTEQIDFLNLPDTLCFDSDSINLMNYVAPNSGEWIYQGQPIDNIFDPMDYLIGSNQLIYELGGTECPNADTITIFITDTLFVSLDEVPPGCDQLIYSPSPTYNGNITDYYWEFVDTNGVVFASSDLQTPDPVTFTSSGTVTVTVSDNTPGVAACNSESYSIDITINSTEPISIDQFPDTLCQNSNTLILTATPNGTWSGPGIQPNGFLDPSLVPVGLQNYTYTTGATECVNTESIQIEFLTGLEVTLQETDPECNTSTYSPVVFYEGNPDSYNWIFPGGIPSSSNIANPTNISFGPDTTTISILIEDDICPSVSDSIVLIVEDSLEFVISPINQPICSGSAPINLEVNEPGGIWTGQGIVDSLEGIFDPSEVPVDSSYLISYTNTNLICVPTATILVEVVASPVVIAEDSIVCEDSEPFQVQVNLGPGIFSGDGIIDTITGLFNPGLITPGETAQVIYNYTDGNDCEVEAVAQILVEAFPSLSFTNPLNLCLSDITVNLSNLSNFNADPTGGNITWTGPGIINNQLGTFNPIIGGLTSDTTVQIEIQYIRNECIVTEILTINVQEEEELEISSPTLTVCIQENTLQLETNLDGGIWTGPGIDMNGFIQLNDAGGGIHTYNYIYQANTSCEQSDTITIQVEDPGAQVDAGNDIAICEGSYLFQLPPGTPSSNGYWTGPGIIDSLSGWIIVDSLSPGDHIFSYCFESTAVTDCSACDDLSLTINPRPIANFDINGRTCINETFCLNDLSTGATSYFWDFGDGQTSIAANPCHLYTTSDTYQISLIATSSEGCSDTISQQVYVSSPPTLDFEIINDEGCAPFTVEVENNSSGDSITQIWYIAGDTIFGSNPTGYIIDGITDDSLFEITLELRNPCDTIFQTSTILVHPYPLAEFGIEFDEGCSPLIVDFNNTTLGNPDTCFWDMGNGITLIDIDAIDSEIPPNQTYTTSDTASTTYIITLIATNFCGVDTFTQMVTVDPPEVEAFIQQDTLSGCQPFEIQLFSFSTPGSNPTWEAYLQGGVDTLGSNVQNPIFTFDSAGIYTIILYAENNCDIGTDTAYIEVKPAPDVSFTAPERVCDDIAVNFLNTSNSVGGSFWDFGDGNTSSESNPTHTFPFPDTFWITLTTFSLIDNCPAEYIQPIIIEENPIAGFSADTLAGCLPLTIQFFNESIGENSWEWDFGDNTSGSIEANPIHTFENPGNYIVRLVVSDEYGCTSDTAVTNVFVNPHPSSAFEFLDQDYCEGFDSLCLINNSIGSIIYEWHIFGEVYSEINPCVLPQTAVTNDTIWLVAINSFGCADTSFQLIDILPAPDAIAEASPAIGCEDLLVTFINDSQDGDNYTWTFGDGNSSTDFSPSNIFTIADIYEVQLVVTNNNGCPADTTTLESKRTRKTLC